MKTYLASTLLLAGALSAQAQLVTISGRIMDPTGTHVHIMRQPNKEAKIKADTLGSAQIDGNGEFKLSFKISEPVACYFTDGTERTPMFLVPDDNIQVSLHTAYFDETVSYSGNGAARNNALANIALADEMNWLPVWAAQENPDTLVQFPQIDQFTQKIQQLVHAYMKVYSEMEAYLSVMEETKGKEAEQNKTYFREQVKFKAYAASMVGKPLSDVAGIGLDGIKMNLSQFKGKTTIVDFWATWCGPCKQEMPFWRDLVEKHGSKVNFVNICVWDEQPAWQKQAKGHTGAAHNMFVPRTDVKQLEPYQVKSIPRYMVIDKDLKIVSIDAPRPSSGQLEKYF